jgi:hypothetical protein
MPLGAATGARPSEMAGTSLAMTMTSTSFHDEPGHAGNNV